MSRLRLILNNDTPSPIFPQLSTSFHSPIFLTMTSIVTQSGALEDGNDHHNLQCAVFSCFYSPLGEHLSQKDAAMRYCIHSTRLNRFIAKFMPSPPSAQPLGPEEFHLPLNKSGGQMKLPNEVESLIYDTALYFIETFFPLTKCDMLDLVVHLTGKLPNHVLKQSQVSGRRSISPMAEWVLETSSYITA